VVFLVKEGYVLDDFRRKIVQSEMFFVFKNYDVEIEEIRFSDHFSTIKVLIPIELQLYALFEEVVESCNQFGDFMLMNYIITNVKELSFEEINKVLETTKIPGSQQADDV
jgi:hypothetical protein